MCSLKTYIKILWQQRYWRDHQIIRIYLIKNQRYVSNTFPGFPTQHKLHYYRFSTVKASPAHSLLPNCNLREHHYNLKIRKVVIIGSQCLALKQGSPRLLFTAAPSRTSALVKSIKIFNSISLLKT